MSPSPEFLATSVASLLLTRFSRTHERRRISVVAGNPGLGKTTAVERFRELHRGQVAVIDLGEGPKGGHTSTGALRFAVQAVADMSGGIGTRIPTEHLQLRHLFWDLACQWGGVRHSDIRRVLDGEIATPPRTIVFDEAQHLSEGGIEALRSLNDAARGGGFSPFPIGLIFVGNHKFALKDSKTRPSVLTEAVKDRLLYNVTLDYQHVTDDDLALYLESRTDFEPGALRLALAFFGTGATNRSFRSADRLLDRLAAEIGDGRITSAVVRHVLALA